MAGAAEFCIGNLQAVEDYAELVFQQPNVPLLDKIDLNHTLMDVYEAKGDSQGVLNLGLELLKEFKCTFPTTGLGITASTIAGLMKAKIQVKKK